MPSDSRASRNKTITLDDAEIAALSADLLTLNAPIAADALVNCTIHQDAFTALDYLPQGVVDLLFIDPPYNMTKTFGMKAFKQMHSDDYESWVESWLVKLLPTLTPQASVYVCGDWRSSSALFRVISRYLQVRNRITWEREKGRGAKSNWKNASEDIWFATVGDDYTFNVEAVKLKKRVIAPYRDNRGEPKDWQAEDGGNFRLTHPSNLWTDLTVPFWSMPENTPHPTQKPEKLLAKIILASSNPDDMVFDPFLGSGTTSVVAKKLGRRYAGIEIDHTYACITQKRLALADASPRIQGYEDGMFRGRGG